MSPQALYRYRLQFPLPAVPAVESTYVVCAENRIVNPDWSRRAARERLDADVIELPGPSAYIPHQRATPVLIENLIP